MTSYNDIITRTLGKIEDFKELSLSDSDLLEIYKARIHSVSSKPNIRKLFSSITLDDTNQTIDFELRRSVDDDYDNEYVIEVLSTGVAIEWLEPKVKTILNTSKFFGGKEEKKLKDSYEANMAMLKDMKIELQKLIRDNGFYTVMPEEKDEA